MPLAIKSYEGGNFPEGPASYWPYATEYFSCALAMLESACGTTFGLDRIPGVAEQTGYLDAMTGPAGNFFNYSDAGTEPIARPRGFTVASLYLARHFDAPESLVEFEMGALRRMLTAKPEGSTRRSYNRLMPLALFWLPKSEPKARAGRPRSCALGGSVPVASMRERWGDTSAAFVAVKGGGPGLVGSSDWALEDISKPPHDYESANPEVFRATMTVTAGDTGVVEFTMETAK